MTTTPTDHAFVPLSAATLRRAESAAPSINIVSQPGTASAFKPLSAEATPTSTTGHGQPTCEPRISLQREGDQVTGIRIHCGCGQVIDLACIY